MYRIEDISFFASVDKCFHTHLQDKLHIKHYAQGSILFYEGEVSEYLHILLEGHVRLYKTTPKSTQVEIHRFGAPELIAEFASFEKVAFPATCEFMTAGTIGLLHFDEFYRLLANQTFSFALINSLTKKIKSLSNYVHRESVFSSEAKVADFILKNKSLFHKLKKSEIAAILNMTPETFSRILSKFKQNGWIDVVNKELLIVDTHKLDAIIGDIG